MNSPFHFILPFLLVPCLLGPTAHGLAIRDTSLDLAAIKGGVLVKNGKQTSCELGVIDSTAAFVAAPCLDYIGNSVDRNTKYDVYLDTGIDNKSAKYAIESITVHPEYNSTNFLNPVAVLQFNNNSSENWSNPIAIDRNSSWGDIVLSRRGLTDLGTMEWSRVLTVTNQYVSADVSLDAINVNAVNADARSVLGRNLNEFLCYNATTYPPNSQLTVCSIPYGTVSTYISGKLYVAGTFLYTLSITDLHSCSLSGVQSSVYLVFADYIAFASKVLGRELDYYPNNNGIAPQSDPEFIMNPPLTMAMVSAQTIKCGDLYANQTQPKLDENMLNSIGSSELAQSLSSGSMEYESNTYDDYITSTDDVSSDRLVSKNAVNTPNNDDNDDLEANNDSPLKRNMLIGVFCAILGGLVLAGIVLYLYDRFKRNQKCAIKIDCEIQSIETQNDNERIRNSKYSNYINTFYAHDEK